MKSTLIYGTLIAAAVAVGLLAESVLPPMPKMDFGWMILLFGGLGLMAYSWGRE